MKNLLAMLSACCVLATSAQDPAFTQYFASPVYLNPALAGSVGCPRVALNYRNQWPATSASYVTTGASVDAHLNQLRGGLGLLALHDDQGEGVLQNTALSLSYAYRLQITRDFSAALSLQAGLVQWHLDWEKLRFDDQIDTRYGFIYDTRENHGSLSSIRPDFASGILFYNQYFYGGAAVHHLTEPDPDIGTETGDDAWPRKYTVHAGATIPLTNKKQDISISPNVVWQQQGAFRNLSAGCYANYGIMVLGLWYHHGTSVSGLVGISSSKIRMAYSYDISTNGQIAQNTGSHELSLIWRLKCKRRMRVINVPCPSF